MFDARYDYWRLIVARQEAPSLADRLEAMRPRWMAHGACRGTGTSTFFLGRGGNPRPARALCAGCSVRDECLGYALADPELVGIWGGTSRRERITMRRTAA